jgi:hypothetical protein
MTDEMDLMLLIPAPVLEQLWLVREDYCTSSAKGFRCFWTCLWIGVKVIPIVYVYVKHVLDFISLGVEIAKPAEVRYTTLQQALADLLSECEHSI